MAASAFRIFFLPLAACAISHAAPPARALDQVRVHAYYHDGEFDKVIRELEAFQKSGRTCSHAESLFVEKHLAVVYAANPGTRELGRYHMFRILDLAPASDLLDMFVGEEVGGVFEKVGKEYALRNAAKPAMARTNPPSPANAAPVSARPAAPKAPATRPYQAAAPAPARPASAAAGQSASAHPAIARPASFSRSFPASAPANPRSPAKAAAGSAYASAGIAPPRPSTGSLPDSSSSTNAEGSSKPAWKEPGLWIGGGAALAVVAFTLFYSGSESSAPQSKTYVVPATASR